MARTRNFQDLLASISHSGDHLAAVVVHLNDTYLIDHDRGRRLPGFAKLIATLEVLRKHVAAELGEDRTIVVHSGDFLGPSRLGKADGGASMVELLNRCGLNYATLGNHEFDYGLDVLQARLIERDFQLVLANMTGPHSVQDVAFWPPAVPHPTIAITGIVSETVSRSFGSTWAFHAIDEALTKFVIASQDALFRIVLTHATRNEDRALRGALPSTAHTIVLGGHDHDIDWGETDTYPVIFKNRANLETVRVLLLMAGADDAICSFQEQSDRFLRSHGRHATTRRSDVEEVLRPLHTRDAAAIRRWISEAGSRPQQGGRSLDSFVDEEDLPLPNDALIRRMAGFPFRDEFRQFVLRYSDFVGGTKADIRWIKQRVKAVAQPDDSHTALDLSGSTSQVDARDALLRTAPAAFGILVAESVRRETDAEIALLNAGSFRCDAILPAVLTRADLRDTFLYDSDAGVLVLPMENRFIDALIAHGRAQIGEGGYPQISDRRPATVATETAMLAISAYLLAAPNSKDGYDEVLAQLLPTTVNPKAWVLTRSERTCGIVAAVTKHAQSVPYVTPPPHSRLTDPPSQFVELVNVFLARCLRWGNGDWRAAISSDNELSDESTNAARNDVRAFLRQVAASPDPIRALRNFDVEVRKHPANFSRRISYGLILNHAAHGISGWRQ